MKASDAYLVKILDTLKAAGLLENTLVIATADHGEMGTAHACASRTSTSTKRQHACR
jgi:arylsulfatase A-like enzyme